MSSTKTAAPAAGAILWRPAQRHDNVAPQSGGMRRTSMLIDDVEVALVHRPRYDDWSFPKGKLDVGETPLACAVREVSEETGAKAVVQQHLTAVRYQTRDGLKTVDYWTMRYDGGEFDARYETDQLIWLPVDDAFTHLSYDIDCSVLETFQNSGVPDAVVMLVRHGKAGRRDDWDGPDKTRPLDTEGRRQAERLVDFAEYFAPSYLGAAPPRRCRDTLTPLAARTGLGIDEASWLADSAWSNDPVEAFREFARLRDQLAHAASERSTGAAVLCSQGGAIPAMLSRLGADGSTNLVTGKGEAWVVTFREGLLLGADRYPYASGG